MKKKLNKKRVLLVIIIIVIILLILLVSLVKMLKNNRENMSVGENFYETYAKDSDGKITRWAYSDVNYCINSFIDSLKTNSSFYNEEIFKLETYMLLGKNYLSSNDITLDNLYDYVKMFDRNLIFVPLEIKVIQDEDIKSFLVRGILENTNDCSKYDDMIVIVNINFDENIFSVEPLYGKYDSLDKINVKDHIETKLTKNDYNSFPTNNPNGEEVVTDYLNLYKRLALGVPEEIYKLISKETKNSNFKDIEDFKSYVDENRDKIYNLRVEDFDFTQKDGKIEYLCTDQYGNEYKFYEKNVLNYTVTLNLN